MAEVGDAGAGVVDGEADIVAEPADPLPHRAVVGDPFVLGDLHDEGPICLREHGAETVDAGLDRCRLVGDVT